MKLELFLGKYQIDSLFSLGLYHKHKNVTRIYLDALFGEKYDELIAFSSRKIREYVGEYFYVCLVDYSEQMLDNELIKKKLDNKKIFPTNNVIYITKYIEEDEWYGNYFIYKDNSGNITKYVEGIVNRIIKGKETINYEVFFLDTNFNTVINVYDDRGMDILRLD